MEVLAILLLIALFFLFPKYLRFNKSAYQTSSGNSFFRTIFNKGNYGEFLTFLLLEELGGSHWIMSNLYIPKKDGSTTEIDLLMISRTGMYVFESKNYSGWIFGNDQHKYWTQTLPKNNKYRFLNPIWQNKGHINALKHTLQMKNDHLFKSYIIFSERCTLKKLTITDATIKVIKRNLLPQTIVEDIKRSPYLLTTAEVDNLYWKLKKYELADDAVKKDHIESVRMKK